MAHQLKCQVVIPLDSAIALDAIVNTWTFDGGTTGATPADTAADAQGQLSTFYNAIEADIMPASIASPFITKWYNLADPPHSAPVLTSSIAVTPGGDTSLPTEVAICLSFEALPDQDGDVIPLANRRGRVFIGPIASTAVLQSGGKTLIHGSVTDRLADAAEVLMNGGTDDAQWAIYSPTWHHGRGATSGGRPGGRGPLPAIPAHSLAESVFDVKKVWVDNAFDTIRSRGQVATLRDVRLAT